MSGDMNRWMTLGVVILILAALGVVVSLFRARDPVELAHRAVDGMSAPAENPAEGLEAPPADAHGRSSWERGPEAWPTEGQGASGKEVDDLVFGVVRCAQTGQPIPTARIAPLSATYSYPTVEDRDGETRVIQVDPDGRFSLSRSQIEEEPFLAVAEGYITAPLDWVEPSPTASGERVVALTRYASLRVLVKDPEGRSMPDIPIRLTGDPEEFMADDENDWLWINGFSSHGNSDYRGVADFPALKPDFDYVLLFEARHRRDRWPGKLRLSPGEKRTIEHTWPPGVRLTGTLLDGSGTPIRYKRIHLLVRADGAPGQTKYLPVVDTSVGPHAEPDLAAHAFADEDGRFELPDVRPGSYWIGPQARDPSRSFRPEPNWISPLGRAIELSGESSEVEIELVAHLAIYALGNVLDSGGAPVPDALVTGALETHGGELITRTNRLGRFILGPMEPGRHRLRARLEERTSAPVEVEPGPDGVVLILAD